MWYYNLLLGAPRSPFNITPLVLGSREANVSWQDGVTPNPEIPPVIDYQVFLNNSLIANVSTTSISLDNTALLPNTTLLPFTKYVVTITARNRIGISNSSEPVTFMTEEECKFILIILYIEIMHFNYVHVFVSN